MDQFGNDRQSSFFLIDRQERQVCGELPEVCDAKGHPFLDVKRGPLGVRFVVALVFSWRTVSW